MSNQLSFSYHTQLLQSLSSLFTLIFIKCESKIKFQGCKLQTKQTKTKSDPGLMTINNQVVFLLDIPNQFKLISYIELNSIGPQPSPLSGYQINRETSVYSPAYSHVRPYNSSKTCILSIFSICLPLQFLLEVNYLSSAGMYILHSSKKHHQILTFSKNVKTSDLT